jgi:hypothetical protein
VTFPVTAAADDLRTQRPGGIHERHRAEPDGCKAVSRQELPLPVRTRRERKGGRCQKAGDHSRGMGRLPPLQYRRDRRGTEAVEACAIITPQPSQAAVTAVVTVHQSSVRRAGIGGSDPMWFVGGHVNDDDDGQGVGALLNAGVDFAFSDARFVSLTRRPPATVGCLPRPAGALRRHVVQ